MGRWILTTSRQGVDLAVDGDTVLVAPGEYVILEPITFRGKAITVKSELGRDETTIRMGTPADPNRGSVVIFENNETAASVLDGFTIAGGAGSWVSAVSAYAGGGIYFDASAATLRNCAIVQNKADVGGGGGVSACFGASPMLTNCIVTGNSATWGGGAHCWGKSSLALNNCIIRVNSATEYGGGIFASDNSSMTMTNCTIAENSVENGGGGVFCGENSSIYMTECIIATNSTTKDTGGGVLCWDSSVTLTRCSIIGNTVREWYAGGIYVGHGSAILTNCVIVRNTALLGGGGVMCSYPDTSLTITNCTIWGNSAGSLYWGGGGVLCRQASATVTNSIICGNTSPKGREISVQDPASMLTIAHSNVGGGQAGVSVEGGCTLNWGAGNIDADPLFADPNNDDFHLKSQAGRWNPNSHSWVQDDVTSPCLDTGDPMSPINLESFPNGGFVNMGAYGGTLKASKAYFGGPVCETIVAGDINGDCQVNRADLEIMALHWTDEEPLPLP